MGIWLLTLLLVAGCGGRTLGVTGVAGGAGEVSVTVFYGDQPAPGAIVQLLDSGEGPLGEQRTDENGTAEFMGVPAGGGYQAIATLEGATGRQTDIVVTAGKTLAKVVISQGGGPMGLVLGSVKLAGADRPLAGVVIEIGGRKVTTDANGQFRLEGVAAGPVTVRAQLGGYGAASEQVVVRPGSSNAVSIVLQPLATGPKAGHTLVATPNQVVELDAWRNQIRTYGASQAWSAQFTSDGGVLVADGGADKVQAWSDSGVKGSSYTARAFWQLGFGGIEDPHGAARTPGGNVIVADTGHDRVVELDGSNKVVWEYKGSLSAPHWAERLPKGNTLIVDTGNNRVLEVGPSGNIVWGLGDGSTDVLNHPTTAQRLPNGNTLVCDAGNGRVYEVNAQNQLVWMAPGRGGDVGRLNNPTSARRLATGTTLVADTDNNRVIELDGEGNVVWKLSIPQPVFADRF